MGQATKKPMITVECWGCEEFSRRGQKQTGYCGVAMKPTWPSVVKACRDDARADAGDFCWYCCPFTDDNDGCLCGDQSPGVSNIHLCHEFNSKLNFALGGRCEQSFLLLNDQGEIVERVCSMMHGTYDWVRKDLTEEWRWQFGWQRYYPGAS
jgi:hypothetical protein